jgi:hypothetical protein
MTNNLLAGCAADNVLQLANGQSVFTRMKDS